MRIVIALGGNALGNTPDEQKLIVKKTASALADVISEGNELIVTHGNGPQVGMINLAFDTASNVDSKVPSMDFPECGAMSQGYIGFHLQNALGEELRNRGINKTVATIVTQVEVDENDSAFTNPTKPIGGYYSKEESEKLEKEKGFVMTEIMGKGYRRVVASPKPIDIVEKNAAMNLIDAGNIVITVGGGGIPVIKNGNTYTGVAAVIDKDYASAKLAELIHADKLIILTAVDKVSLNFGKENQQNLDTISIADAKKYAENGEFGKGSMLPKINAAISFVENSGKDALIAGLENVAAAIHGESGTVITK